LVRRRLVMDWFLGHRAVAHWFFAHRLVARRGLARLESAQPHELTPIGHRPQPVGKRFGSAFHLLPGRKCAASDTQHGSQFHERLGVGKRFHAAGRPGFDAGTLGHRQRLSGRDLFHNILKIGVEDLACDFRIERRPPVIMGS
jgi:hypothetical protein